ncbi:MAG: ACT domain-containing protein [Thermodesulfobacteriota bacterium]
MPTPPRDPDAPPFRSADGAVVLRLAVRNHPGVLSHVSGLFARRAFNVDGVLCLPVGDGARSAILLLVRADDRLEQLVRQLAKLEDVLEIRREPDGQRAFAAATAWLG